MYRLHDPTSPPSTGQQLQEGQKICFDHGVGGGLAAAIRTKQDEIQTAATGGDASQIAALAAELQDLQSQVAEGAGKGFGSVITCVNDFATNDALVVVKTEVATVTRELKDGVDDASNKITALASKTTE
jgi:hypothetical protein